MNRFLLLLFVGLLAGCGTPPESADRPTIASVLQVDTTGYDRADTVRPFDFPRDHDSHDGFRLEWWYFTGNLAGPRGERFGYQFTVFRTAVRPPGDLRESSSTWRSDQLYSAHMALTDVEGRRFRSAERFSRPGPGLAGSSAEPFRVWVEDWEVAGGSALDSLRIRALQAPFGADPGFGIELDLAAEKPIVLQGNAGLSAKGFEDGQASYYYSIPRLATTGMVVSAGDTTRVQGRSWLDREWSTSLLSEDQTGWDWFSIQLEDGYDLMYFQLRSNDGDPFVHAARVLPGGTLGEIDAEALRLTVLDRWRSPDSGIEYPSGWRIEGPDLDLEVTPLLRDQELDLSIRYWEGAVTISGRHRGAPTSGRGYVELTGYSRLLEGDLP